MTYIDEVAAAVERRLPAERRPGAHAQDLYRLYAVLVLTLGEKVTPADVHDAWSAWMARWDPSHESIRPFDELNQQVQLEDQPYVEAIRSVARERVVTPVRV